MNNDLFQRAKAAVEAKDLHFPEGLLYEDYYFTKSYMLLSKDMYFVDEKLYNYIRRSNSIMVSTFNGNSRALDHMKIYLWLFDDYIMKYNLIGKDFDYFVDEFCAMFSFSKRYSRSQDHNDLYYMVEDFLDKYKEYLDSYSSSIYLRIKQLVPNRSLITKVKNRLKQICKKHSLRYRHYSALEERLSELDTKLSKSVSELDQQLSQINKEK